MALTLSHDVETADGVRLIDSIAEIEEKLGLCSSWNIVPLKYETDPGLIRDLQQRGHEFGVHGYNHDGKLFFSEAEFDRRTPAMLAAMDRMDACGFRAPMVHRNLDWIGRLRPRYDASCFDVDPFQPMPGGVGSVWPFLTRAMVELPYTMPQDHTLYVTLQQNSSDIWQQKSRFLYRNSGMAMMLTHPDYLDSPSRRLIYEDFLKWALDEFESWHALPREVAEWWRLREAQVDPMKSSETEFGRIVPATLVAQNDEVRIQGKLTDCWRAAIHHRCTPAGFSCSATSLEAARLLLRRLPYELRRGPSGWSGLPSG